LLRLRLLLRRRVELTRRLGCRLLLRLGLRLKLLRAGIGTLLVRRPEPTMAVITTAVEAVARRLLLLGRRRPQTGATGCCDTCVWPAPAPGCGGLKRGRSSTRTSLGLMVCGRESRLAKLVWRQRADASWLAAVPAPAPAAKVRW
jgi:hypothetical protein